MQCVCHTWDWSPSLALSPCLLAWRTPPWFSPSIADTQPGVSWDCSGQHNAPCSSTPAQTVTCHTVFWMYNKGGWPQSTCTPTHYICSHIANLLIREATEWSGTLQEYYRHSESPSSSHSSGIMLLLVNLIMKYMKYIGCSIVYNWGFIEEILTCTITNFSQIKHQWVRQTSLTYSTEQPFYPGTPKQGGWTFVISDHLSLITHVTSMSFLLPNR